MQLWLLVTQLSGIYRLLWWLSGKEPTCQCRIRGLERSPREGNADPLQYSCLGNPMDRGAWQATIPWTARVGHGLVTKQQRGVCRCCGWHGLCPIELSIEGEPLRTCALPSWVQPSCLFLCNPTKPSAAQVTKNKWFESTLQCVHCASLHPKATVQFAPVPLLSGLLCFSSLCFSVLFCELSSSGCSKASANEGSFLFLSPSFVTGATSSPFQIQPSAGCGLVTHNALCSLWRMLFLSVELDFSPKKQKK